MHMLYTHVRLSFGGVSGGLFRSEMNSTGMHHIYVCHLWLIVSRVLFILRLCAVCCVFQLVFVDAYMRL
jgi:hypothetical protein